MSIYLGTDLVTLVGPDAGFLEGGRFIGKKTYNFKLSDTNFSSLTLSNTDQNLTLPATNYTASGKTSTTVYQLGAENDNIIIDRQNYDYEIFGTIVINYDFGQNDMTSSIRPIRYVYITGSQTARYTSTVDPVTGARTFPNTHSITGTGVGASRNILLYQKADNKYALYTTAVGVYGTISASFSNNTNTSIPLICSGFKVKGNNTYCPVSSLNLIDATKTTIECTWYIYEGNKTLYNKLLDWSSDLVANPREEVEE